VADLIASAISMSMRGRRRLTDNLLDGDGIAFGRMTN